MYVFIYLHGFLWPTVFVSLGNVSSEELEKYLMENGTETETFEGEEEPTEPTIFDTDQVFLEPLLLHYIIYILMHYKMLNTQNTRTCHSQYSPE